MLTINQMGCGTRFYIPLPLILWSSFLLVGVMGIPGSLVNAAFSKYTKAD
jgi:hypothetical protein